MPYEVSIELLDTAEIKNKIQSILPLLCEEDIRRAERYVKENDRLLSLGGAYLVRRLTGRNAMIKRDRFGKPRTENMSYSLSHSGDTVGIAYITKTDPHEKLPEIGLDIEKNNWNAENDFEDIRDVCLTQEEKASGEEILTLYTAKESLGKARGDGIRDGVIQIPALPGEGPVTYKGETYYRVRADSGELKICVCVKGEEFTILKRTEIK